MDDKSNLAPGDPSFDLAHLVRQFFEISPQPKVVVEGSAFIVRRVNAAFLRLAGVDESELIGRPFANALPKGATAACLALLDRVFRTGTPEELAEQKIGATSPVYWSYEVWPIPGGDERPVGLIIRVTDSTETAVFRGQAVAMNESLLLSALRQHELTEEAEALSAHLAELNKNLKQANDALKREISERKRAEEALQQIEESLRHYADQLVAANKELESFSYSISHDLRAPLLAMKGFSNILLNEYSNNLDAAGQDFLKRIVQGSEKMSDLIDDMLGLAKISRQEISLQEIDLSTIAASIVEELRRGEPERKVTVVIANELKAHGDARLMNIVLSNLIGNAWKFTSKKNDARIEVGALEKSGEMVYYVKDNGAGFDMTYARKLFAPFQRLHSDIQFSGTGIGLAIVKKAIQRHGGRVWAESEVGTGATFFFTLHLDKRNGGGGRR
jgi:signal transduction histidine kinase